MSFDSMTSDQFAQGFSALLVRVTIALSAALIVTSLLRRRSAATRHGVWMGAFGAIACLPLLMVYTPAIELPVSLPALPKLATLDAPMDATLTSRVQVSQMVASSPNIEVPLPMQAAVGGNASVATPSLSTNAAAPQERAELDSSVFTRVSWRPALFYIAGITWMVGTVVCLVPVCVGWFSLRRLAVRARPTSDAIAERLAGIADRLGIAEPITCLETDEREMPMTWGVSNPVVMLPSGARYWTPQRLTCVLWHELTHIRRWDCATQLGAQVIRAIYWFHPLVWLGFANMKIEQENACDDAVLQGGTAADHYAEELLRVTSGSRSSVVDGAVALAMGKASRIRRRLETILDGSLDRRPLTRISKLCIVTAVTIVTMGLALVRSESHAAVPDQDGSLVAPKSSSLDVVALLDDDKKNPPPVEKPAENAAAGRNLMAIRDMIRDHYVRKADMGSLDEAAIRGMLESLKDPYAELISEEAFRNLEQNMKGQISGIGTQLAKVGANIVVMVPLPKSPALNAGIKPNDVILAVDGKEPGTLNEAAAAIRGREGTKVVLKLRRGADEIKEITVTRGPVPFPSIKGLYYDKEGDPRFWLDATNKVAYVQLTSFTNQSSADVQKTVQKLRDEGLKGLIIDLRMCPGGALGECVNIAKLFLKPGKILTVENRGKGESEVIETKETGPFADVPLTVIIDETAASAAEVLTSALQDHNRAIVLGTRSFGKGSIQSLIPLEVGNAIVKLTTAQIVTPNGRTIQHAGNGTEWGVDPNDGYYVPLTNEQKSNLRELRTKRDVSGALDLPATIAPELIEKELGDPQLAAALRATASKVQTGEFVKSGKPLAEMKATLARHEQLRKQRDELQREIQQIQKELDR